MSQPVPQWAEAESSAGAVIPWLAVAAAGRWQTAYRAYLDHAQECPGCRPKGARCDAAQELWTAYRQARP
jgi:hypothetical protein